MTDKIIANKRIKAKLNAFCGMIEDGIKSKSNFYICSHDNPDPDALSCAFGMLRILSFLGVEEKYIGVYYNGEIGHPQNRAMMNILNIPIKRWGANMEIDYARSIFIFVDCAGKQKNMTIPPTTEFEVPHIAIDHHKTVAAKNVLFMHDEVGACATLITDLMLALPARKIGEDEEEESGTEYNCFDPDADEMKDIATALAIGIKTDTLDFRSETTSDDDYRAYKFLSSYVSDDKFNKIVNYDLPPYIFEYEHLAWANKINESPNLITGLGFIEESHSDCVPYLADHLMRLQGIQTVMVYAIVDNAVRFSIRTISASVDAAGLCQEIAGEGNGGGKHGIAGGSITFTVFDNKMMENKDREALWALTKSTIEGKFLKATRK